MECPNCQSDFFIKNGNTYYGKQRFKCKNCGRQFIENSALLSLWCKID
jgi:predicted Zn finger-like uncharacterized protein